MKWIVGLLVLANAAYAWWQYQQDDQEPLPQQVVISDVADSQRLYLLHEVEDLKAFTMNSQATPVTTDPVVEPPVIPAAIVEPQQIVAEVSQPEPVPVENENLALTEPVEQSPDTCLTLGPIPLDQDPAPIHAWYKLHSANTVSRLQEEQTRTSYWVYLPPAASRTIARERIKELKAQGITDYFMVNNGENKHAISLGVYSSMRSVRRRLKTLTEKGFNAETLPRERIITSHWIDIVYPHGEGLTESAYTEAGKGIPVVPASCNEIVLQPAQT